MERPDVLFATTDDGLRIAYQVFGAGERDLVFVPPLHSIDTMWDEPSYASLLGRLASFGRVIALDFRGWGASDPVPLGAPPTAEAWMEDIRVVLDQIGSERATLIAESGSCFLTMMFAATYPERARSMILMNSYARIYEADDYPIGFPESMTDEFVTSLARTWGEGTAVVRAFAPSRAHDPAFRRWHNRHERSAASPSGWESMIRWAFRFDLREILSVISVPTLVIHREDGIIVPIAWGRYVAEHIPGATFRSVAGMDQYLFSEGGDAILDDIEEFVTGLRPALEVDRVLATVLFTDIVDSTDVAARLGDASWRGLLDRHDVVVRGEIERHRGRQIKMTGDGVLATFDGPARAARCAREIIERVRPLGITARAGLHTGEVELRGDDIGGIAVHIGQRVSSLAGPGEVLVSRTVTDLVAGSGLEFEERGEYELKGVPGTWAIYAVKT